jgi:hypothetical protein
LLDLKNGKIWEFVGGNALILNWQKNIDRILKEEKITENLVHLECQIRLFKNSEFPCNFWGGHRSGITFLWAQIL